MKYKVASHRGFWSSARLFVFIMCIRRHAAFGQHPLVSEPEQQPTNKFEFEKSAFEQRQAESAASSWLDVTYLWLESGHFHKPRRFKRRCQYRRHLPSGQFTITHARPHEYDAHRFGSGERSRMPFHTTEQLIRYHAGSRVSIGRNSFNGHFL